MKPLYEMTADMLEIQRLADEGVPMEQLQDTAEVLSGDFNSKVDACLQVVANLQAEADMLKTEIDKLAERKKSAEASAERLKQYVKQCMVSAGINKAGSLKMATITKPRKVVQISDESSLPTQFVSMVPKIDRRAIEVALKDGESVSGAELVDSEPGLRIK